MTRRAGYAQKKGNSWRLRLSAKSSGTSAQKYCYHGGKVKRLLRLIFRQKNAGRAMQEQEKAKRGSAERAYREGLWVLQTLEEGGYQARFAGGSVRDRILGRIPKDFDVATNATPDQVCLIFKQKGVKVVPTGIDHGTVTVVVRHAPIEVTTLRRDVKTDGRHAQVAFGSSFEDDALRRDFTINAMFEDRHGKIYDYFGGRDDIKNQRLRFVGDAVTRIREDYLRMLRLFRFWARLGFAPDEQTLKLVTELADGLQKISQERITSELLGTLSAAEPLPALKAMHRCSIFNQILIGLEQLPEPMLQGVLSCKLPEEEQELCLLAVLFQHLQPRVKTAPLGQKLRLPKRSIEKITTILEAELKFPTAELSDGEILDWVDQWEQKTATAYTLTVLCKVWPYLFPDKAELVKRIAKVEEVSGGLRRQELPLTGHDLSKVLQLPAGPVIGDLLRKLKTAFRNREWRTAEEGLALARRWLAVENSQL
ncbi:MAG: CCA tRNA nucleotidyltransferase [Oligoflexus sp.]